MHKDYHEIHGKVSAKLPNKNISSN